MTKSVTIVLALAVGLTATSLKSTRAVSRSSVGARAPIRQL